MLRLEPNHVDALAWAGDLATKRDDASAARAYAGRALALSPGHHGARITLAVAGFTEKDLTIETQHGVLTVSGRAEEAASGNFLYRGISSRQFERSFQLAEHVEVRGAKLENGLLQIELERVIPEEMKPRRIAINGAGLKTKATFTYTIS